MFPNKQNTDERNVCSISAASNSRLFARTASKKF
jgi:hypothetical protein